MSSLCGVPSCKYEETNYGVCDKHKSYSYKNNDSQFNLDIQLLIESRQLFGDRLGVILSKVEPVYIERHYTVKDMPEAQEHMDKIRPFIETLKDKYDHALVMNVFTRINHLETDCNCEFCSLGTST